jgi:hypothetical protein
MSEKKSKQVNLKKDKETAEGFYPSIWIKKEKNFLLLIVIAIVPIVLFFLQKSLIKMPGLYLECEYEEKKQEVSLSICNKGDVPSHRVKLNIFIPRISKDTNIKRTYKIVRQMGMCKFFEEDDSTLTADFQDIVIHPTLSCKREYLITEFKFKGATEKQLKKTKKSLKYRISSEEGIFEGSIPIADIFKN